MSEEVSKNQYARFLKEQGTYVVTVEGIDWYDHSGFMIPAYLPHCCPEVRPEVAQEVVRISGKPFAQWDSQFGKLKNSEWWWVLKKGRWAIEDIKDKKKRWMIRQGRKNFSVRPLSFDEVLAKCPTVAEAATARYEGDNKVETHETLQKRIEAAQKVPGVLEYAGCFQKDKLVSFSENYIQDNAVWLANIRHDPIYLKEYSSYALVDGLLDYYLNGEKMDYVFDGWRSTHHRTEFQTHLMKVFGFVREYAVMNIVYSVKFGMAVKTAYLFRYIVWALSRRYVNKTLDNICAVLRQEHIRRACLDL